LNTLQKPLKNHFAKEHFVEKFYHENESANSKILVSVLKHFDNFCSEVYGNNPEYVEKT
jgi:hypothetical protein